MESMRREAKTSSIDLRQHCRPDIKTVLSELFLNLRLQ